MFVLDFKSWLESAGEVSTPPELTNVSLGIRSKIEAGSATDRRKLKSNPFITRRKEYGKHIASNCI